MKDSNLCSAAKKDKAPVSNPAIATSEVFWEEIEDVKRSVEFQNAKKKWECEIAHVLKKLQTHYK